MGCVKRHIVGDVGVIPGIVRKGRAVGEVDHCLDFCDDIAPAIVGPVGEVALHAIDWAIPGELAQLLHLRRTRRAVIQPDQAGRRYALPIGA